MRSETSTGGQQKGRTFIETARRAQIMAAAIDAIAELGFGQASLARIAERAGTSKGVILYHFSGKDDLIRELVAELSAKGRAYLGPRLEAEPTGAGMLRAYIESNLAFVRENRNHVLATVEIALNGRSADGSPLYDMSIRESGTAALRELLAHFQGAGEFRADFDPLVMATAIRATLDAVPARLTRDPDLDLGYYGRELADLFHIATRPRGSHPGEATPGPPPTSSQRRRHETLLRDFTHTVMVSSDQPVITAGPYRILRHPSYTAVLLIGIGVGLASANWAGLAAVTLLILTPLLWRIHIEENALMTTVGDRYRAYAAQHKRLVPLIWSPQPRPGPASPGQPCRMARQAQPLCEPASHRRRP